MSQSPEYDPRSDAYRLPIDPAADSPIGTAVAMGIAALEGVDEAALPTLQRAVDAEAVEALLDRGRGTSADPGVVVEFPYAGYRVTARPDELLFHPHDSDVVSRAYPMGRVDESNAGAGPDGPAGSTRTE